LLKNHKEKSMVASVTAFAGSVPQKYDAHLGPMLFEPYAIDIASRLRNVALKNQVLEIACGTGRVTKHLHGLLPSGGKLVATDLNKDMMEIAKTSNPSGNIEWQVADAQDLHFADESFDAIVCQFGYMFMPDKEKAFSESHRVLKNGGALLFNCWDKLENNVLFYTANNIINKYFPENPPVFYHIPFSFYDTELMRHVLIKTGFKNISIDFVEKEAISIASGAACGIVEGNPVYGFICERDPSLVDTIRNSVEKEISSKYGSDPLKAPMYAWVVQAWK
jgi:ubiquinone/menaquinone biosynthesis C-methylase UbiE